jgi:hypothetical protein
LGAGEGEDGHQRERGYRRFPPRVDYAEHRAVLAKKNYLLRKSKADKEALVKYAKEAMGLVEKDLARASEESGVHYE